MLRHARRQLGDIPQERQLGGQIHQARNIRSQPGPDVDIGEGVVAARTQASFMVVRKKLGLVSGQVNAHRAIALAAFAGEAKIKRLFHGLVAPAVPDHVALRHLPQQVGAAAGGVLFVAGHAKARTHYAAFIVAAFPDSDAAQSGACQAALVFGKLEMSLRLPGIVSGAQAQIFIHPIGLNYLARIHLPGWVPDGFEFAEGLQQFRPEHSGQQFGPRLPVAMLAGD